MSVRVSLWSVGGGRRLVLFVAAGAVAVVGSWFVAAGRNDPGDQLVFVSLSLFGLACEFAGVSRWIMEGRSSIRRYRRNLFAAVATTAREAVPVAASSDILVARPEGRWIHRADCPLVKSRQWAPVSPAAQHEAGRRPCPACRP